MKIILKCMSLIPLLLAGASPAQTTNFTALPDAPAELPGKGMAQHDFLYAGEAKTERLMIVRAGKIVRDYIEPVPIDIAQ
jgi:hypothetical protein